MGRLNSTLQSKLASYEHRKRVLCCYSSMERETETPDLRRRNQREGNILRGLGKTRKNYNIAFQTSTEMGQDSGVEC